MFQQLYRCLLSLWAGFLFCSLNACTSSDDSAHILEAELEKSKWTVQKAEAQQAELVDQLQKDPTPKHLLAVLATTHPQARSFLGPHRLTYTATFSLQPDLIPELPEVDRPRPRSYAVEDRLILTWASNNGESPRFHLLQGNEKLGQREVVLIDDHVYSRLPFRTWFVHPQESDMYERWLADAQRSLFDVIEFIAPNLAITVQVPEADHPLIISLMQSPEHELSSTASGVNRQWRTHVKFTKINGKITIHPQLGLWTAGDIDLAYELENNETSKATGSLQWSGHVEALPKDAADQNVVIPSSAEPIPERLRYEVEKNHLLDGLAGLP